MADETTGIFPSYKKRTVLRRLKIVGKRNGKLTRFFFRWVCVFFGKFNINKDFMVINYILLLAKLLIYRCKVDRTYPSLS